VTVRLERSPARAWPRSLDVRPFLPSFLLGGYGVFILSLFARGVMTWYINPGYVWSTTLAGAVLCGIGAVGLTRRQATTCESCGTDCDCGCGESSPRAWTYGLLSLPLFLALIFPPRGLAAFSANERGPQIAGISAVHGIGAVRRVSLSVDTRSFSMQDWVGALSADPNPRDYKGKPVRVSGMILHASASVPAGYVMVMRYLVTCCIADARPVGVIVKDTSHGALRDSQWVTVTGTMGSANEGGQQVTVVNPTRIVRTKSSNPYIY
jgi:putative membrane protein